MVLTKVVSYDALKKNSAVGGNKKNKVNSKFMGRAPLKRNIKKKTNLVVINKVDGLLRDGVTPAVVAKYLVGK